MATVTVSELAEMFEGCDRDLIEGIHGDARGNRTECISTLEALTGMPPRLKSMDGPQTTDDSDTMARNWTTSSQDLYTCDYEATLATGEEKKEAERNLELNELIKHKINDIAALSKQDRAFEEEARRQRKLGAQSLRGGHHIDTKSTSGGNKHFKKSFDDMLEREKDHCGEFVCFYHSYSFAALIYEIQACIARTAYGLSPDFAPLPRLLKGPFRNKPHQSVLLGQFSSMSGQDHDPRFRAVAISVSCSIDAPGSEAPPMGCFAGGYSCNDLSFVGVVKKIFTDLGCSDSEATDLLGRCRDVANEFGLHPQCYNDGSGGAYSNSGGNSGHMLQIFIRSDCVDDVAYGSHAYGVYDPPRNPLSQYLTAKSNPDGQARIFWHPTLFCDPSKVKLYHYGADDKFYNRRLECQRKLEVALKPLFDTPKKALRTFYKLEGIEP